MTYDQWKTTPPWDKDGYCCPRCGAVSGYSGICEECADEEAETWDGEPINPVGEPAQEKAMGPRENPLHPMFRDHNCAYCRDGELPCRQGAPNRCEYPHARND